MLIYMSLHYQNQIYLIHLQAVFLSPDETENDNLPLTPLQVIQILLFWLP